MNLWTKPGGLRSAGCTEPRSDFLWSDGHVRHVAPALHAALLFFLLLLLSSRFTVFSSLTHWLVHLTLFFKPDHDESKLERRHNHLFVAKYSIVVYTTDFGREVIGPDLGHCPLMTTRPRGTGSNSRGSAVFRKRLRRVHRSDPSRRAEQFPTDVKQDSAHSSESSPDRVHCFTVSVLVSCLANRVLAVEGTKLDKSRSGMEVNGVRVGRIRLCLRSWDKLTYHI